MITDEWQTTRTSSTTIPTSESILAQALPGVLAAPAGWRSELIQATSTYSTDSTTNLLNSTSTSSFEKQDEYKTLNTADAPPIIFSSTNETNRIINEIPSTTLSGNSISEYSSTSICEGTNQDHKTYITKETHQQQQQQTQEPIVVRKTLPNNTVTYQQNVQVRYLQPPTPPPPGPIIIREVQPPPPPPQSPVKVRQRPPPPATPPPLVIRERPPPAPERLPTQVVEKVIPPPPPAPRRLIVERYAPCPPKPGDVVIERWLPYRRTDRRRILYERAPAPYLPPREPNLLVLHDQPHARVHKEFINQGVVRADPLTYLQRYGSEIDSWHAKSQYAHIIHEADRAIPPPHPIFSSAVHHDHHDSYANRYPSSAVSHAWERMRSVSPLPHTNYPPYDSHYRHSMQSPFNYHDHLGSYQRDLRTMVDVTPSWGARCGSTLPSYEFSPSYPSRNFQSPIHHDNDYYPHHHARSPIHSPIMGGRTSFLSY